MNKKRIAFVIVLLLFCGVVFLVRKHGKIINPHRDAATKQTAIIQSKANAQKFMAIDGLSISQGEAGKLEWKLTAEQAGTGEVSAVIKVTNPFLTFFVTNSKAETKEDVVTVESEFGEVDRATNNIRFIDNVRVESNENHITTGLLEFVNSERILYCPGTTQFTNPTMRGTSGMASFVLDGNILNASGHVIVDIILSPSVKTKN
jgi:LPS export ABC transporter protein LptC